MPRGIRGQQTYRFFITKGMERNFILSDSRSRTLLSFSLHSSIFLYYPIFLQSFTWLSKGHSRDYPSEWTLCRSLSRFVRSSFKRIHWSTKCSYYSQFTIIFRLLMLVLCLQDNLLLHYVAEHVLDYNSELILKNHDFYRCSTSWNALKSVFRQYYLL